MPRKDQQFTPLSPEDVYRVLCESIALDELVGAEVGTQHGADAFDAMAAALGQEIAQVIWNSGCELFDFVRKDEMR